MYLKSIKINGFKSFAKPVDLKFKSQISGIVGPNGSGKSNTAEAFRFVLGEQSMKNMRGKKGEDLIFTGKNGRLNRASVKVVFDNRDKSLDIGYDEVSIERVVFRDGTNEYFINDAKVRVKDIQELLASANIGSSGHHIISQGEADKILSISPKERKNVLEEALGLKSFVMKKNDAERKLEKTEENLREVRTRERVNAPRLRFLEKEVQKIQKAKELKEELLDLYSKFFPYKYFYQEQVDEINKNLEEKELEKKEIEKKWEEKNQEYKNLQNNQGEDSRKNKIKIEIAEIDKKINEKNLLKREQEKEISRLEYELEVKNNEYQKYLEKKNDSEANLLEYQKKVFGVLNIISNSLKINVNNLTILGEAILDFLGIKKEGDFKIDFNEDDLEKLRIELFNLKKNLNILDNEIIKLQEEKNNLNIELNQNSETFSQSVKIEILELEKKLADKKNEIDKIINKKIELLKKIQEFEREETYFLPIFGVEKLKEFFNKEREEIEPNILERIVRIRILLENNEVNLSEDIEKEYLELKEKQEFVKKEVSDLEGAKIELLKLIADVSNEIEKRFRDGVEKVNGEFSKFFSTLFMGGKAEIILVKVPIKNKDEDKMEEFELGLDIKVSLPNKKITGLGMLSGGERSLTSIALLFAMSSITPPPFIILDETDAALDEANSKRYGDMIEKLAEHSQLILITHNRETMSRAGILYGVTMDSDGISKVLSISFDEGQAYAK